jgi:hypothetical protein
VRVERSTFVIDADGNVAKAMRKVKLRHTQTTSSPHCFLQARSPVEAGVAQRSGAPKGPDQTCG